MLTLGSKEQPAIVTCDVVEGRYRYIFVKVSDENLASLKDLEQNELSRFASIANTAVGSNLHRGECRIRIHPNARDMAGRKVICDVQPGAVKFIRGKYRIDLYATSIKMVGRRFCWRL